jgi:hypothetical protein
MSEKLHDTPPTLLEFLDTQPAIRDADPATTELYFDLDETMFRQYYDPVRGHIKDMLIGNWRPDMLDALRGLHERGFQQIHVLSSAHTRYIAKALEIFDAQFGEDPAEFFGKRLSTRDLPDVYLGNKAEAINAVSEEAKARGARAVFIDDARLSFGDPFMYDQDDQADKGFDFIRIEDEQYFRGEGAELYQIDHPWR